VEDFAGVHDLEPGVRMVGQGALDLAAIADEVEGCDARVGPERQAGAFDDHATSVVASHHINGDAHWPDAPVESCVKA